MLPAKIEKPSVRVEASGDGMSAERARELAAALIKAASELDGLAAFGTDGLGAE
jgi:hypothetical protein